MNTDKGRANGGDGDSQQNIKLTKMYQKGRNAADAASFFIWARQRVHQIRHGIYLTGAVAGERRKSRVYLYLIYISFVSCR